LDTLLSPVVVFTAVQVQPEPLVSWKVMTPLLFFDQVQMPLNPSGGINELFAMWLLNTLKWYWQHPSKVAMYLVSVTVDGVAAVVAAVAAPPPAPCVTSAEAADAGPALIPRRPRPAKAIAPTPAIRPLALRDFLMTIALHFVHVNGYEIGAGIGELSA
jgi:hypothetical protein